MFDFTHPFVPLELPKMYGNIQWILFRSRVANINVLFFANGPIGNREMTSASTGIPNTNSE